MEALAAAPYPRRLVHATAGASCLTWWAISLVVHVAARRCWKGYSGLTLLERRQFCNKVSSGIHAAILAASAARNLAHPALLADPLGLAASPPAFHYFWASVLAGYLLYDTIWGLLFYSLSTAVPFLVHHVAGLAGCILGAYHGRLALFGLAIEIWLEGTTPLLHVVGCMRIARLQGTAAYRRLAAAFAAQFFVFRLVVANCYLVWLLRAVLQLERAPWWAWAGVAVFAVLSALNAFWFAKLLRMVRPRPMRSGGAGERRPQVAGAGVEATLQVVSASKVSVRAKGA